MKILNRQILNGLVLQKTRYESLIEFIEKIKRQIKSRQESISPKTTSQLLTEINRIIEIIQNQKTKIEQELMHKIDALKEEKFPLVSEKIKLDTEYADNELLWKEKIIEQIEYTNQKNNLMQKIKTCESAIEQLDQKLRQFTDKPDKRVLQSLTSVKLNESKLNKLWQLSHHTTKFDYISFNITFFIKDKELFKELERYRKKLEQLEKKIEQVVQAKKKQPKSELDIRIELVNNALGKSFYQVEEEKDSPTQDDKLDVEHDMLLEQLNHDTKEYENLKSKLQERTDFINKALEARSQILTELTTELSDYKIISKDQIYLDKFINSKLTQLGQEIKQCKEDLKPLLKLQEIYANYSHYLAATISHSLSEQASHKLQ